MKKIIFFYLFPSLLFGQNILSEEETNAIKRVIVEEQKAFYAGDIAKWESFYRKSPETYWAIIKEGNRVQSEGWENIRTIVKKYLAATSPIECSIKREKLSIREVTPNHVWLTFDQNRTYGSKKEFSKQVRILELIDNDWKLVQVISFTMPKGKGPVIPYKETKPDRVKEPQKSNPKKTETSKGSKAGAIGSAHTK